MKNTIRQLLSLLDTEDRRSSVRFVVVSFLTGVIEVAGIGSVMPFIAVLMQPDLVQTNRILSKAYAALSFTAPSQFVIFMGCATLTVIIAGGIVNILCVRYQMTLTQRIGSKWATRLFSSYLHQPYRFFLDVNSNAMKSNILSEVDRAIVCVLIPASTMVARSMVVLVIFILLMFVNPGVTMFLMIAVGGAYGALLVYFRNRTHRQGAEITAQNKIKFQVVSEAFSSIRDIKLYHNQDWFEQVFASAARKGSLAQADGLYSSQIPRFAIEMAGFVALISIALCLVVIGETPAGKVIPMIALFAGAGYKLLPAAQNLYASLSFIRLHGPAVASIADGIFMPRDQDSLQDNAAAIIFDRDIEIRNLTFSYNDTAAPVLRDVNCTIARNTLVAVAGPTGAGKSTLIDLLAGLLKPTGGEIMIDGLALGPGNVRSWQKRIGYVPQKIYLLDGSIESNIAFAEPHIDPVRVAKAAKQSQIDEFIRGLPEQYQNSVGEHGDRLSGGQRQRIGVARSLYHDPSVLILDEPTSALDSETALALLLTLKTLSCEKTIIMITHAPDALSFCDQVLYVENGQILGRKNHDQRETG